MSICAPRRHYGWLRASDSLNGFGAGPPIMRSGRYLEV
jgi:hypothetical protein